MELSRFSFRIRKYTDYGMQEYPLSIIQDFEYDNLYDDWENLFMIFIKEDMTILKNRSNKKT